MIKNIVLLFVLIFSTSLMAQQDGLGEAGSGGTGVAGTTDTTVESCKNGEICDTSLSGGKREEVVSGDRSAVPASADVTTY